MRVYIWSHKKRFGWEKCEVTKKDLGGKNVTKRYNGKGMNEKNERQEKSWIETSTFLQKYRLKETGKKEKIKESYIMYLQKSS